ncbi:MAG: hypothetical protein E4H14_10320 [Candidatus Thorarchaeota archaeon]|nr:MAG: hypothetical protein E4H14_10320 [Candidatus Thorarchaeota archaeon]
MVELVAETTSNISFIKIEGNRTTIDNAIVLEDFRTLVTALRLTSSSSIGLNTVSMNCQLFSGAAAFTINSPALIQFNPAPEIFPGAFSPFVNTQCILDKFELELFQRLYKRLREIQGTEGKLREQIQRALRRYNVALISDQAEDSIVDAIIALEILFKSSGFKMAFRASLLSSIIPEERKVIVKTLEKCHRVRSEIVHGSAS